VPTGASISRNALYPRRSGNCDARAERGEGVPARGASRGAGVADDLEFEHPDPKALESALAALGIAASVRQAADPRLVARLKTPKGPVGLI